MNMISLHLIVAKLEENNNYFHKTKFSPEMKTYRIPKDEVIRIKKS